MQGGCNEIEIFGAHVMDYIQYILHSLVLIFDPNFGGGVGGVKKQMFFLENNSFSFHVFFAFDAISNIFRKQFGGGGGGW